LLREKHGREKKETVRVRRGPNFLLPAVRDFTQNGIESGEEVRNKLRRMHSKKSWGSFKREQWSGDEVVYF